MGAARMNVSARLTIQRATCQHTMGDWHGPVGYGSAAHQWWRDCPKCRLREWAGPTCPECQGDGQVGMEHDGQPKVCSVCHGKGTA